MLEWLIKLPIRKRVGLLAIFLGILAIFLGNPYNKAYSRVNLKEIALLSPKDIEKVETLDLADWIIQGKYDYRLLDLRTEKEFNKYNIPMSENVPVQNLLNYDIQKNEKILLYGQNDIVASKGWFILKADGFRSVYLLDGGMKAWKDCVLYPIIPENLTKKEKEKYNKIKYVSKYFGGIPQTQTKDNVVRTTLPKLKAPPKKAVKVRKHKAKREGC